MDLCNSSNVVVLVLDRLAYTAAGGFLGVLIEWRFRVFTYILEWLGARWMQSGHE